MLASARRASASPSSDELALERARRLADLLRGVLAVVVAGAAPIRREARRGTKARISSRNASSSAPNRKSISHLRAHARAEPAIRARPLERLTPMPGRRRLKRGSRTVYRRVYRPAASQDGSHWSRTSEDARAADRRAWSRSTSCAAWPSSGSCCSTSGATWSSSRACRAMYYEQLTWQVQQGRGPWAIFTSFTDLFFRDGFQGVPLFMMISGLSLTIAAYRAGDGAAAGRDSSSRASASCCCRTGSASRSRTR